MLLAFGFPALLVDSFVERRWSARNGRSRHRSNPAATRRSSTPRSSRLQMNPFKWLLEVSAAAAQKRGGGGVDPLAFAYAAVDARDDEEHVLVDGADFFNYNKKEPERWLELSTDRSRFARVTQSTDGSFRLHVYERSEASWRGWEGPSIVASLEEAQTLGRKLLQRSSSPQQ